LLFLCIFTASSYVIRYDGYKVIRLSLSNENHFQQAFDFANKHLHDVWATNVVEGWMDIMIEPTKLDTVYEISHLPQVIKIEDVQAQIDQNEIERNVSRKQNDFFTDFPTVGEITAWLNLKASQNPGKAKVENFGSTHLGEQMLGMRIGQGAANKKVFVIHCGIHAREWITPTSCCWMIDQLLGGDTQWGDRLTQAFEWIIIPVMNVDGYSFTHTSNRLWRKNRQPNAGSTCIGTDLNRNYDYGWSGPGASNNPCSETYYGASPFSGPEARSMRDVLRQYWTSGRLLSYWDIHAYGALWMSPWGYTTTLPPAYPEMAARMQNAVAAAQTVNGRRYAFGSIYNIIYQTSGGSIDYSYGEGGITHSYSVETFGSNFTPPPSWILPVGKEVWMGVRQLGIDLFPGNE